MPNALCLCLCSYYQHQTSGWPVVRSVNSYIRPRHTSRHENYADMHKGHVHELCRCRVRTVIKHDTHVTSQVVPRCLAQPDLLNTWFNLTYSVWLETHKLHCLQESEQPQLESSISAAPGAALDGGQDTAASNDSLASIGPQGLQQDYTQLNSKQRKHLASSSPSAPIWTIEAQPIFFDADRPTAKELAKALALH